MRRWKVSGRIRADIKFDELVPATSEVHAAEKAIDRICERHGITEGDYIDDEVYCEELK